MKIIFDDHVDKLRDRFTLLELDTFAISDTGSTVTAWCVLDEIPLTELPLISDLSKIHQDLMQQYRAQNWDFCKKAIEKLSGRWNGEMDSFYSDLLNRINGYIQSPPESNWNGFLVKTVNQQPNSDQVSNV